MKVPLQVLPHHQGNKTKLEVWANKTQYIVEPPTPPYIYSDDARCPAALVHEKVIKRSLKDLKEKEYWQHFFSSTSPIKEMRGDNTYEDHIQFHHRIFIDSPDFILSWPNTAPLKIMYVDLEQDSVPGIFPHPDVNPIIAIAFAIDDGPTNVLAAEQLDDHAILRKFLSVVSQEDPDVIVTYNGNAYDIPLLLRRCEVNDLSSDALARSGTLRINSQGQYEEIEARGRVYFDVYLHVLHDQTLSGIKNKKMKTVAEWMKIGPVIRADVDNMRSLVGKPELKDYVANDVHLTRELAKVYMPITDALAEVLRIPFDMASNYSQFLIGTITQGRAVHGAGFVADGDNAHRNSEIYEHMKDLDEKLKATDPRIYMAESFHTSTWKIDFKSMYPTIYTTFNLSPETVRLIKMEDYDDRYEIIREGDHLILKIPDTNLRVRFIIQVDLEKQGNIPQTFVKILERRFALKKRRQEAKDEGERARLHALENALKIVPNAVNGNNGSGASPFGNVLCYISCTGIGRLLCDLIRPGIIGSLIEEDTDGFFITNPVDLNQMNKNIKIFVEDLGLKCYLEVEQDAMGPSYFYKTKNYIIIDEKGRFKKKGGAMIGSDKPPFADIIIERVGRTLLLERDRLREVMTEVSDLAKYSLPDFFLSVHLHKSKTDYGLGSMHRQLADQYNELTGEPHKPGQQVMYAKTMRGYTLSGKVRREELDLSYYQGIVDDILESLSVWSLLRPQSSIDDYT